MLGGYRHRKKNKVWSLSSLFSSRPIGLSTYNDTQHLCDSGRWLFFSPRFSSNHFDVESEKKEMENRLKMSLLVVFLFFGNCRVDFSSYIFGGLLVIQPTIQTNTHTHTHTLTSRIYLKLMMSSTAANLKLLLFPFGGGCGNPPVFSLCVCSVGYRPVCIRNWRAQQPIESV
jgi:hypothetical protein